MRIFLNSNELIYTEYGRIDGDNAFAWHVCIDNVYGEPLGCISVHFSTEQEADSACVALAKNFSSSEEIRASRKEVVAVMAGAST